MDALRRTLLKGAGATGAIAAAMAAGVLKPSQVLAADINRAAFEAKDIAGALKAAGAANVADSTAIAIKAPDIAENGAVVPIEVSSSLPNTVSLSVLVDKNPFPLTSSFEFTNGAVPEMSLRVKMGQTSLVEALAKTADGKHFIAKKEVKVTVGGCGG
ncbi:MAG: thiosulfate oxidation carrier protein SoxY [Rhodocyclaceae bacterium]|jgi:sulfur-oxidizing protein SoxY|nr:thiosulfate oxidation carrier protein SoxY [Rhodocyclaceae bacterium]MCC6879892.1 thiosulfate oxidation carrier protein SoxY [Rhodocyclaceae bacterium]MCL4680022.1 thiosulfate oxidation carrier protein SoxY [Rhodocyclaceae bacterium]CAG1017182.1 sulfur-oxidizing protein SoxY [Burkholderiaceae bacterium]